MKRKMIIPSAALVALLLLSGCRGIDSGAYDKGMEALENRDYDTAIEQFQLAAEEDDREAEAYRGEGIVYLEKGDYTSAEKLFAMSLDAMKYKNEEFSEDVLYYEAESCYKAGDTDQADQIYRELLEGQNPAKAYLKLGELYMLQGDTDQAVENFSQALSLSPDFNSYIEIYESFKDANMEGDGARYLEEALELTPTEASDYYALGKIYYYLQDYENAKIALNQSIELGDQNASLLLGSVCLETGDISGARNLFQGQVEAGNQAEGYNGLALCDMTEGNYDAALSEIATGLESANDDQREVLLYNEILVYEYMRDFATAKQKMAEFLTQYPMNQQAVRENKFLSTR